MRATAWMGSFLRALTSCPADADGLVMNAMKLTIAATAAVLLASAAPAGAKTYVGAPLELGQYDLVALERPKTLLLGPPGGSLAEMMLVRRVRWSSWGSPNATARGVHKTKDYDPWASVRRSRSRSPAITRARLRQMAPHGAGAMASQASSAMACARIATCRCASTCRSHWRRSARSNPAITRAPSTSPTTFGVGARAVIASSAVQGRRIRRPRESCCRRSINVTSTLAAACARRGALPSRTPHRSTPASR